MCQMEDQARHLYKKEESENIGNIDTIKQEREADKSKEIDYNNGKIKQYHDIITNKREKDETIISKMEQWSILSNILNYVQYNKHPKIIMI